MRLTCFEVEPGRVEIRPAEPRRAWMDATPAKVAYHCTPINMANSHGWEMLCPVAIEAEWNGEVGLDAVQITYPEGKPAHQFIAESRFTSGIVTLNPTVIIRTPPGHNLWVQGPPNVFKDGIAPLSGLIEADWMPFTFTMNWKITRPGHKVRFERGEPFCFFFPVVRGLVDGIDPVITPLQSDVELMRSYLVTRFKRNLAAMTGAREDTKGWYTRGEGAVPDHQTRAAPKPFRNG